VKSLGGAFGLVVAACLGACQFTFVAHPVGWTPGKPFTVKQADLEVQTEGLSAPNDAKNVAAYLDLRNVGMRPIVIVEIDLVGVDGVAVSGSTQRASSRALDAEPKAAGLELLPLTIDPGGNAPVAVRWRIDQKLETICADRCTIVIKEPAGEVRVDLLDDAARVSPR
jgi:hypothetical protein